MIQTFNDHKKEVVNQLTAVNAPYTHHDSMRMVKKVSHEDCILFSLPSSSFTVFCCESLSYTLSTRPLDIVYDTRIHSSPAATQPHAPPS